MSLSPAFIWNAVAIALGAVGGVLFLWAMFWDRARVRLRCPKCWYDMKGAVEAKAEPPWTCSECGRVSRTMRGLRRTRRRKFLAAIGVLVICLALYAPSARLRVLARGWMGALPTIALAVFAPMDAAAWEPQLTGQGPRMLPGGPALPPSESIRARLLAELIARLKYERVSRAAWRIAMVRAIGPTGSADGFRFTGRAEWPGDVEAWAFVGVPDHLAPLTDSLRLRCRQAGNGPWDIVDITQRWGSAPGGVSSVSASAQPPECRLGMTAGEGIDIEVELLAGRTVWRDAGNGRFVPAIIDERVVWRGRTSFARVVQASASSIMQPHTSESADARVASMISPMFDDRLKTSTVGILMTSRRSIQRGASEFAIGMRLEVLRDGEVVATGTHIQPNFTSSWESVFHTPLNWRADPPTRETMRDHEWRLRVTGDPEVALRDYETNNYWNGSFSMPLLEFLEPTFLPARGTPNP